MIHLNPDLLIGKGSERSCYSHPLNSNNCIKVIHTWSQRTKSRCSREIRYIKKYKSQLRGFDLIPNYYGTVETNLGTGYIFQRIKDWNGNNSEKLSNYIKNDIGRNNIGLLITNMYKTFLVNKVLVSDLHAGNILVNKTRSESTIKLILIDGFGNSDLIKICDYSSFFMKKKLIRKFTRMKKYLGFPYQDIC